MINQRTRVAALLALSAAVLLLSSCSAADDAPASVYPTYDPFLRAGAPTQAPFDPAGGASNAPRGPVPTYAPLRIEIPARADGAPLVTPTPDPPRSLPTPRQLADEYVVQPGDTIGAIAQAFGVGVGALLEANELSQDDILSLGTTLRIPSPEPSSPGPSFKIIPDSELVYGPAAAAFDIGEFVSAQGGYLGQYSEELNTAALSGSAIVELVAENYSVNPRLLLALLEHRSHWITQAEPRLADPDYPLGFVHPNRLGLYRQLAWAANELNRGYYLWRANAVGTWVLSDGTVIPIDPTINAGTAAVQHFFSVLDGRTAWGEDANAYGLFQTYFFMFGNPFDLALEPLVPVVLQQPTLEVPFEAGISWAFTGGPHAAWDSGSGWGALDFAPPDVMGCSVSEQWITAAADGFVVRAADGAVVQDLDGDGFEQTGWNILYMHVFEQDRVLPGAYLYAGDRIGHPSCEGGISNASHLHIARKYNGEWIPADGSLPLMLGGWISSGDGTEYDGALRRGSETLLADEGASESNMISR
jgi:LysM repeat protein